MTRQREFKSLVRERMEKTGERYTTARAQILAKLTEPQDTRQTPGVLGGYDRFGGINGDTAVLHNVLRFSKIKNPLTQQPFDETTINGLCGGPGFLYAVFEYKGWPPMLTIVMRSRSMPDVYVAEGLKRLGVKFTEKQSVSAGAARKALDAALSENKPAICTVDIASLPWYGLPKELAGGGPHTVAVIGKHENRAWIDDRAPRPIPIDLDALDNARARYRAAKSRLITIDGADAKFDLRKALSEAIIDTAKSYDEYAVPKSFQSNCGFAGLEKWRDLLTNQKDKKGWPTVLAEGPRAYAALSRLYACLQYEYTAPAGGRAWYADFLDRAADWLNRPKLRDAASAYRRAGKSWEQIAKLVSDCEDRAVRESCELADKRAEMLDHAADGDVSEFKAMWDRRQKLGEECALSAEVALKLYAKIADVLGEAIKHEREAVTSLQS